jgi:hypothetical protein
MRSFQHQQSIVTGDISSLSADASGVLEGSRSA